MKILVLNGPNLNMLGKREVDQYGTFNLIDIENELKKEFNFTFEFFQSNHEGELIDKIQSAPNYFDGLVINPGGYSHTSVAIRDALSICKIPKVEVHISNLARREDFRQRLLTASVCDGYISGFKIKSYIAAVYLISKLTK
ncbi:3-dehydroquinate dehydratase ii [hydrocarbon metagenome]|uniref:3-dehydroquinate dehydratase n=1 Tax=hydrocarbon metagenome TaxID=938273 RepID=A0A0W8FXW7_9ZZZZ